MPPPNATKKKVRRLHPSVGAILLVLESGKIRDVVFSQASGHVLVADLDALKGLPADQKERAILLGAGSMTLGREAFEALIEKLINEEPEPTPAESPAVPVGAPPEPTPVDPPVVVVTTPESTVGPQSVALFDPPVSLSNGETLSTTLSVEIPDATGSTPAPEPEPEVTGPLPNPAAV